MPCVVLDYNFEYFLYFKFTIYKFALFFDVFNVCYLVQLKK